ncbi:HdeD family acid-resistance protein [Adhaeribacter soli]|uniref:HdeD family acid-resistance protein n=1 Tax=Adhaeribacter soli TaxID=2607655 RepID=A0A5N1IJ42_9BACT|nr:HdeD family acid-resistance protein [Adhaeribacter soli]KAA9325652.1 HdeD family acid-resistance protein [Adhaeribacter soli]
MENPNLRHTSRYWYLQLILGIFLILVGIWVFMTPLASYVTLAIFFAFAFLITGVLEIIYAVSNRKESENWGWSLVAGIIDLVIGILLISRPQMSMIVLPFYIGFGILFRSIMAVGWSLFLKRQGIPDWGNLLAIGILGIIFAFIMLWNPIFAGFTIVFYTAFAFIIIGVFQIYLAFRLRKFHKRLE